MPRSDRVIVLTDDRTYPDQIDAAARAELWLLFDERIVRCWRTAFGFLIMTNLRCSHVWRKPHLFNRSEWHVGPTFFFYRLASPRVVAQRFVELANEPGVGRDAARFLVRNPHEVSQEIDAARAGGRAEWEIRRARVKQDLERLKSEIPSSGSTVILREVVKVRCRYCGNLMDVADSTCPTCGAPQR
jgi:hypothetical protein